MMLMMMMATKITTVVTIMTMVTNRMRMRRSWNGGGSRRNTRR